MTLLDGGLTPTLSRELALFGAGTRSAQSIRDLIFSSEVLYAMVLLIVGTAFSLAAPLLAVDWIHVGKLPVQTVVNALRVMSLVLGLRWIAGLYKGAYIGLQKQVWLTLCSSFFATARGGWRNSDFDLGIVEHHGILHLPSSHIGFGVVGAWGQLETNPRKESDARTF